MKITILNGDMSQGRSTFTENLKILEERFQKEHACQLFHLESMNLKYCTGCWSCWWKTPGKCVINDDAEQIFRSVISSDFVIFASPLMAGFTSSALKKITDRLILLLHPYILLKNGECHHHKRYDTYPDIGVIIENEPDTDGEDLEIVKNIYDRFAINFHCRNTYLKSIDHDNIEDIIHETCNI